MVVRVLVGDALSPETWATIPSNSVHCVVTSPPYWGLRDYGTGTWEGGDPACEHRDRSFGKGRGNGVWFDGGKPRELPEGRPIIGSECHCGARRIDQQIGLEDTPEAWAARLVEVFREVRRVLRPDGVCFVNVGDSYAGSWGAQGRSNGHNSPISASQIAAHPHKASNTGSIPPGSGLKPKDLIGQPWLLAFALRADGWWLRDAIVWSKAAPMPESVSGWRYEPHRIKAGRDEQDRPIWVDCPGCARCLPNDGLVLRKGSWRHTNSYEMVFHFAKSAEYFGDGEAVREPSNGLWNSSKGFNPEGQALRNLEGRIGNRDDKNQSGRNPRNVWTIATEPFPEAHFATFPTELARRCILAGTSAKGCCPSCGAPWARVVERERIIDPRPMTTGAAIKEVYGYNGFARTTPQGRTCGSVQTETLGWRPTCSCDVGAPIPCTVLDPFGGSGTTGLVAEQLGRDAILIELSPDYAAMAERRIARERSRRMLGADVKHVAPLPGQLDLLGDGA